MGIYPLYLEMRSKVIVFTSRHPRARGDPGNSAQIVGYSWIPACAGMTMYDNTNLTVHFK